MSSGALSLPTAEPVAVGAMEHAFARAADGRQVRRSLAIAGSRVEMWFAGDAMIPAILGALGHLPPAPASAPDLVVRIWDGASTGVELPATAEELGRRGACAFQPEAGIVSLLDHGGTSGFLWARDATLPWTERPSPLRVLFHHWSRSRGLDLVHAAAVGTDRGALLLVGPSGSGKSTTALACLRSGMRYMADDYLIAGGDQPMAWSVYSSAKLHHSELWRFPLLAPLAAGETGDRKHVFLLAGVPGVQLTTAMPLRAIVLPRIVPGVAAIEPASAAMALAALAPSTLLQLPAPDAGALRRLARLVGRLPRFVLRTGSDPAAIPDVLTDLLTELDGG